MGTKNSFIIPENISPAIIAPPKPCHNGSAIVIGISPNIVASDVNTTGSKRLPAASTMAFSNVNPSLRLSLIFSITTIA